MNRNYLVYPLVFLVGVMNGIFGIKLYEYTTDDNIYLRVKNDDGYIATIYWSREPPLFDVVTYLRLESPIGVTRCEFRLLGARDTPSDIEYEFRNLYWIGERSIKLELKRVYYQGNEIINFNEIDECS